VIDDPARLLAQAEPAGLLPARRGDEAARLQQPLELLAHAPLGGGRHYLLVRDARGMTYGVPAVVADGRLRRAVAGDGASDALLAGLVDGLAAPLSAEVLHVAPARGEHAVPVDQTNDLVLVGDSAVVKWFLHPAPEPQPGSVRARQLQGLSEVPRAWALVHADVDGAPYLVATVSDVVPDAEDGWDWAVDDVRGLATGTDPVSALDWPSQLGDLTARLHVELARHGTGYATADDARTWQEWAVRDLLDSGLEGTTAEAVRAAIAPLADSVGTPVIGIHGDLHVGQVLRTRSTRALHVIDLDGSPLLTAEENLRPQPAARDVAGMLASLDHVGRVVLHRTADLDADQRQRVLKWIGQARAAFLTDYRDGLAGAGLADLLDESLLRPMLVQQECREYAYARRYLPHWRYVPDAALPALLEEADDEA
jgi:maltokinase